MTKLTFEMAIAILHRSNNVASTVEAIGRLNPKAYEMFVYLGYDHIHSTHYNMSVLDRQLKMVKNITLNKDLIYKRIEENYVFNKYYKTKEVTMFFQTLFDEIGVEKYSRASVLDIFFITKQGPARFGKGMLRGIKILERREELSFDQILNLRRK